MSTETTEETTVRCSVCGEKAAEDPCSVECWENIPCTHDESEWGNCVACGANTMELDEPLWITYSNTTRPHSAQARGCLGRGWYHDGSEDYEASLAGRKPRPCPHCTTAVSR